MTRRISNAVRQHRNVAPRAARPSLVLPNEGAKAAAERWHQEMRELAGYRPDFHRMIVG
jgi:hypothetical protein